LGYTPGAVTKNLLDRTARFCAVSAMLGALASSGFSTPPKGDPQEWIAPTDPAVLKNLDRWQDEKIGLLLHWGLYSEWGIVESWTLVKTHLGWNKRPDRFASLDDRAYEAVYENLMTKFDPIHFNPTKWAKAAKEGGVKYVLSMTKHHDGFCMWDTKTTDYKITSDRCPFHTDPRADVVKQMSAAFRKAGLSSGLYFSKADWHSPDYWLPSLGPGAGQGPNYDPLEHPTEWEKFKDYSWSQIEELTTGYGKQDILWLDGGAVRPPKADIDMDGMAAMARKNQPGLIVVDRTVAGPNENYITPEGQIPAHFLPYPWETCMPMGTSWPWRPNDDFKSVGVLVRNLCHIVARGGNYLIGIGPDATGDFDPTVYTRLKGLGNWLKINGEAIYSTRPIQPYETAQCVFTHGKNGANYAIVLGSEDQASLPESVKIPSELLGPGRRLKLLGFGQLSVDPSGLIDFPQAVRDRSKGGIAWVLKIG
jgi:alpha-L-fucosidase